MPQKRNKQKLYDHHYYFGRDGRDDKLPILAAFGKLNKKNGDDITADYTTVLYQMFAQLKKTNRNHRRERCAHIPIEQRF